MNRAQRRAAQRQGAKPSAAEWMADAAAYLAEGNALADELDAALDAGDQGRVADVVARMEALSAKRPA